MSENLAALLSSLDESSAESVEGEVTRHLHQAGMIAFADVEAAVKLAAGRAPVLEGLALALGRIGLATEAVVQASSIMAGHGGRDGAVILLRTVLGGPAALRVATALAIRDLVAGSIVSGFRSLVLDLLIDIACNDHENPDHFGRMRVLALCMLDLGRFAEAKRWLEQALRVSPQDNALVRALAAAEIGLGNTEAAAWNLEYARALSYPSRQAAPGRRPIPVLLLSARRLNVRAVKIARFLRPLGWRVEMLCMSGAEADCAAFDAVHYYTDDQEAVRAVKAIGADVNHFLCSMTDYAACALALAQGVAPVVADAYDVINEMLTEEWFRLTPPIDLLRPLERYVLDTAHGLCMRNLQPQVLKRCGMLRRRRRPVIFFPEYAWNDITRRPKLSAEDGVMRVVYAGCVGDEYLFFCRMAERHGFEFHLYPTYDPSWGRSFEEFFRVFIDEAERNPRFRLHRPLFGPEFLPEMSRYDVQINVDFVVIQSEDLHRPEKIRYGYANKFADCVDADLMFVCNAGSFCVWLGERLGFGAGGDRATFEDGAFWESLRQRSGTVDFARIRQNWNMASQIGRLDRFYRRMMT